MSRAVSGGICAPGGFMAAGVYAGIKKNPFSRDLALIFSQAPATAAGVFTKNKVKAACVLVSKDNLKNNRAQAIIANSGNANCCTGRQGAADSRQMAYAAARALGIKTSDVLVASTGVIGKPMPMGKVLNNITALAKRLSAKNSPEAAGAIMTTDKVKKEYAVRFHIGKTAVTIGGIAKGSGMICPDMGTMLCFIATDAAIDAAALKAALKYCVDRTFNCITVDGDTSTNDMALILANGVSGNKNITLKTKAALEKFKAALLRVMTFLAKMIVRDGEGATKLIEVCVKGAASDKDARLAARAVANSNLVKTSLYGQDANWGRIAAALGRSGADLSEDRLRISLNNAMIFSCGLPQDADEGALREILSKEDVKINIDLGLGSAGATVWACDLSEEYVRINAKYRT